MNGRSCRLKNVILRVENCGQFILVWEVPLIPNPIHKALLILKSSNARFLLMGGQACILYGAAEFSRDLDLTIGIDAENIKNIKFALSALEAKLVFVPDLDITALQRGHTCHFRCHSSGAEGLRIDLMSKIRGCPDFTLLWERRTEILLTEIGKIGILSLPDLIQAKKTLRDKDWPMIRRLIEADWLQSRSNPKPAQVRFWLMECRTPALLVEIAQKYPEESGALIAQRVLLEIALRGDIKSLESSLRKEEDIEKEKDRLYWAPLRAELEQWQREKHCKKT